MIDLHLHTTASDGRFPPDALMARVSAAGLTRLAVTDHDTVASVDAVAALAAAEGRTSVSGIEITAVDRGRDVHILGYGFNHRDAALLAFLEQQRALRVARVRDVAARLATLGVGIDVETLVEAAASAAGTSIGRPAIARALVASGRVASVQDAFDRYLAEGRPAFVPRTGRTPAEVVAVLHRAGGIASMAHPGVTRRDELIPALAEAGLDAIEAFHSDHTPDDVARYCAMADALGLAVSGGSDFHADPEPGNHRTATVGGVVLPEARWPALEARLARRRA